jgi:hypothetical protein
MEEFKIPETWEVYSTDDYARKGKTCNAKITAAVRMALADMEHISKTQDIGPKTATALFKKHVKPVFDKYKELGTYDTEPRMHVANVFAKYATRLGVRDDEDIYEAIRWGV